MQPPRLLSSREQVNIIRRMSCQLCELTIPNPRKSLSNIVFLLHIIGLNLQKNCHTFYTTSLPKKLEMNAKHWNLQLAISLSTTWVTKTFFFHYFLTDTIPSESMNSVIDVLHIPPSGRGRYDTIHFQHYFSTGFVYCNTSNLYNSLQNIHTHFSNLFITKIYTYIPLNSSFRGSIWLIYTIFTHHWSYIYISIDVI